MIDTKYQVLASFSFRESVSDMTAGFRSPHPIESNFLFGFQSGFEKVSFQQFH